LGGLRLITLFHCYGFSFLLLAALGVSYSLGLGFHSLGFGDLLLAALGVERWAGRTRWAGVFHSLRFGDLLLAALSVGRRA